MDNQEIINQIEELLNEAFLFRLTQVSKMYELTRKAYALSTNIGYKLGIIKSLYYLGLYHSLKRNTKDCLQICSQMINVIGDDKEYELFIAHSKKLVGIEKVYLGEHDESFRLLYEALDIYKRLGQPKDIYKVQYLIANSWRTIGNLVKSLDFLQLALKTSKELDDKLAQSDVLTHLAITYILDNSLELAKKSLFDVIPIQIELGLIEKHANSLYHLGCIHFRYKDFALALDSLNKSLEVLKEVSLEDAVGKGTWFSIYNLIGFIHVIYEDYAKAEMYYSQASYYADYFQDTYMFAESNLRYSVLRFHQKNFPEATKHAAEAIKYFDKIEESSVLITLYENACDTFKLLEDYKTCYELAIKMMDIDAKKYEGFMEQRSKENEILFKYADVEKQLEIERENAILMNQTITTLTEQNSEKNEFMGIVAHDLKNPISNIKMLSKLLVSQAPTINEEGIKDIAGDLMETSERMFDLVDKLLDFNAIESGSLSLELQSLDINLVLQKVMKHNKVSANSKDIEIIYSSTVDKNIISDESRLFQVFENLLSNAIKYTKPSSTVSIRAEQLHLSEENQGNSNKFLKVEIQDQGQGIPEDEIPNLFKKFARLSTKPTAGEHSTGLGLSIVKRIVEQLQGTVYCESIVGKGSTFIVELPLEIS